MNEFKTGSVPNKSSNTKGLAAQFYIRYFHGDADIFREKLYKALKKCRNDSKRDGIIVRSWNIPEKQKD